MAIGHNEAPIQASKLSGIINEAGKTQIQQPQQVNVYEKNSEQEKYNIIIKINGIDFFQFQNDKEIQDALLTIFKKASEDTSITFKKLEEGSIKITLSGSPEGLKRLAKLIESGELGELGESLKKLGLSIESSKLVSTKALEKPEKTTISTENEDSSEETQHLNNRDFRLRNTQNSKPRTKFYQTLVSKSLSHFEASTPNREATSPYPETSTVLTIEKGKPKHNYSWGNVPSWIAAMVAVTGLITGGLGSKVIVDNQYQDELQKLEDFKQQKEKLDAEIANLEKEIEDAQEEKNRLMEELDQANKKLAEPVTIDISNSRPVELIVNRQLQPKGLSGVEMTLDKILVEKGVGMTFVFTTWNKNTEGYVNSSAVNPSRITDDIGNEYALLEAVGPSKINAGTKAEHKLRFPIPKVGANQVTVSIKPSPGSNNIFNLPPFSITLPD